MTGHSAVQTAGGTVSAALAGGEPAADAPQQQRSPAMADRSRGGAPGGGNGRLGSSA